MPSFVVHGLLPPLLLLAMGAPRRAVFLLWPLALLPDLDHFIGVPRASLHNLFVLLPFAVGTWLSWTREEYAHRRTLWTVALAYLASHLVMDAFNGGWTPLFPFLDFRILVTLYVLVTQPEHDYQVVFEWGVREGPPTLSSVYLWLSPFEVAMVALTVVAVAVGWAARRARPLA